MAEETETQTETQDDFIRPIAKPKVTLKRNSKGVHWEITSYNDDVNEAKRETIKIDSELLEQYKEANK